MSAKLALQFNNDGTMLYEHRINKDSDQRVEELLASMKYMDVRHIGVCAADNMTPTHCVLIMTMETHVELGVRLDAYEHDHALTADPIKDTDADGTAK